MALEQQLVDMLEGRIPGPERIIGVEVDQLIVRFDRRQPHPVEREQQDEDDDRQRQIERHQPSRQRLQIAHALAVIDAGRCRAAEWPSGRPCLPGDQSLFSPCCHLRRCRPNQETMIAASRNGIIALEIAAPSPSWPADDCALIGQGRHQVCRVDRAAPRHRPDQLEVSEGEQHRERHHDRDDRRQQRIGDVAEHLPAALRHRASRPRRARATPSAGRQAA